MNGLGLVALVVTVCAYVALLADSDRAATADHVARTACSHVRLLRPPYDWAKSESEQQRNPSHEVDRAE